MKLAETGKWAIGAVTGPEHLHNLGLAIAPGSMTA